MSKTDLATNLVGKKDTNLIRNLTDSSDDEKVLADI